MIIYDYYDYDCYGYYDYYDYDCYDYYDYNYYDYDNIYLIFFNEKILEINKLMLFLYINNK